MLCTMHLIYRLSSCIIVNTRTIVIVHWICFEHKMYESIKNVCELQYYNENCVLMNKKVKYSDWNFQQCARCTVRITQSFINFYFIQSYNIIAYKFFSAFSESFSTFPVEYSIIYMCMCTYSPASQLGESEYIEYSRTCYWIILIEILFQLCPGDKPQIFQLKFCYIHINKTIFMEQMRIFTVCYRCRYLITFLHSSL